ncbi:MAG: SAM-dependent methyltransferase [Verrucomicrobia bacterium]|jgi:methyltransferase (TIGR00027 family)|nr:MAG: SAM-dependent methyltransferase [Verrucomicrobiota bacterium]PYL11748.1 MAG: SAM-dependent methyltransferase [Verrucomicrobiota bacterium]
MNEPESGIRNISDTARWVAVYRARETQRTDAVFRDPFARQLAGERGEQIAASMSFLEKNSWPFVARTWLIDHVISSQVKLGTDMVVNLAAGLDARPYRMNLPGSLQWIEVDLSEILAYKEDVLRNEAPVCQVERVRLDLSDVRARRDFFSELGRRTNRALVVSEGLLVYLDDKEVMSLGQDLAVARSFQHWVIDLASPALLKMLAKKMGTPLDQAGAPLKFAPREGPEFFARSGWKPVELHSVMHAAAKLNRLPFFLRLIARMSSPAFQAKRPWSAVCLLETGL